MEPLKAPGFSDEESFVLCDAATKGFPILHASLGFQKLYGFNQEECFDSSCGALVGADGILKDPLAVTAAERQIGSPQAGLAAGFAVMHDVMVDFVDDVVHQRETNFPAVLTVNRKSNGQLFTCQMSLMRKHHPELGWSYMVGLQQDVSSQIPVPELLKAAAQGHDGYKALCSSQARRSKLAERLQTKEAESHFHGIMRDAWRSALSRQMSDTCGKKMQKSRSMEERTIASVSTACSLSSVLPKKESKDDELVVDDFQRSSTWSPDACFHLGAIAKSSTLLTEAAKDSSEVGGTRFLDLLEPFDDEDLVAGAPATAQQAPALQCPELEELEVPIFLVSPAGRCPVVLSSFYFAKMLGYDSAEVQNSSLWLIFNPGADLADQVEQADLPQVLDDEAQVQEFWAAAEAGEFYKESKASTSNMKYDQKPQGELFVSGDFLQRGGSSLRTAVYLKQIELDDKMLIAGVAQPFPRMSEWKAVYQQVNDDLDKAIEVIAAEFFYSAPMRRQTAVGAEGSGLLAKGK
ncbi:unnamed protein product [Symbiodinium necroappetens]|uniref:PAS domain-containing protein n=1 Tax=Symbiodinium necroappetens TaxID=1628268 RepID=A0A812L7C0_9DINO|nr:unnamed protein product [Symbiodinium necroappetens]CAE7473176.1 unnamed protein product [Symbiodinium sp. KB8]CAE7492016.1 unnamed protein product [Symbiodinium microadriaticum]|mmetsp:Transcript_37250/g.89010  ORF Transcript_37250/g.89010 Transcript_37250/m.89010 type:complete len:520 (+) Transcript_37250:197-1756(+)|eukprot:CAMPEP_0181430692 /NCGR_PEP_ID=MMETSP1110-20121109/17854_1 /TAXON_ID=174948 /ORGANISM="Symbiodinium sp., Strain CCMP421" /LENGTH=519 /DNA_ID=CAMNT_0023554015 /DNA_START=73 /DNA_END=1632 /DNA_ORIENTATION=-